MTTLPEDGVVKKNIYCKEFFERLRFYGDSL